jgi:hypothetical protein
VTIAAIVLAAVLALVGGAVALWRAAVASTRRQAAVDEARVMTELSGELETDPERIAADWERTFGGEDD